MDETGATDTSGGIDETGGTGEALRHVRKMRARAQSLEADAERSADPDERRRLQGEVERLEFDCEQESMMAAGDIYPTR
ncbi:DUF6381 family protein [Streptomyces sp. V4-01]|uniref:DUF6381 family protein n=1 Tax=Actinacidiphila polyblastidii TaxID=3110430 RepID=A0ABU7P9I7_9ACTN|nr:DUF6381 family protein [Streptomyces sp. V4-01]